MRLWVATLGTGHLDTLPGHGTSGADVEPAWSPDGADIVFASSRSGPTELYLLHLANGHVAQLTHAGGTNGQPTWTTDGRVVYTSWAGSVPSLHWIDARDRATVIGDTTTFVIHDVPGTSGAEHPAIPLP